MDKIDLLKAQGNLVFSSINAIAFVLYNQPQNVQIVTGDTGYKMFMIRDNEVNHALMNEYHYNSGEGCFVELDKYNHLIKMLKDKVRYFVEGDL